MLLSRWVLLAAICVAAVGVPAVSTAEADEEMYLQARVDKLESELAQLRELLADVIEEDTPIAQPDVPAPAGPSEPYTVQMPVRAFPQAHQRELSGSGSGSTPALTFQVCLAGSRFVAHVSRGWYCFPPHFRSRFWTV